MPALAQRNRERDATHGFALDVTGQRDVNGILVTSDAGATWQRVTVPIFV